MLVRGNGNYSLGEFDGSRFIEETGQFPCDQGPNFYATMSWGEIEGQPGRRVQMAWMRCDGKQIYPDMPFNQQVTFPCDLTLRNLDGSLRLFRKPVREIEQLHRKKHTWKDIALSPGTPRPLEANGDLFHILAEVEIPKESELAFQNPGDIRGHHRPVDRLQLQAGANLRWSQEGGDPGRPDVDRVIRQRRRGVALDLFQADRRRPGRGMHQGFGDDPIARDLRAGIDLEGWPGHRKGRRAMTPLSRRSSMTTSTVEAGHHRADWLERARPLAMLWSKRCIRRTASVVRAQLSVGDLADGSSSRSPFGKAVSDLRQYRVEVRLRYPGQCP